MGFISVDQALHTDPAFTALSWPARYLWWHIHCTLGYTGIGYVALHTAVVPHTAGMSGADEELARKALDELEAEGWLVREDDVLWLRDVVKSSPAVNLSKNPRHVQGLKNHLADVPRGRVASEFRCYYNLDSDTPGSDASGTPSDRVSDSLSDRVSRPNDLPYRNNKEVESRNKRVGNREKGKGRREKGKGTKKRQEEKSANEPPADGAPPAQPSSGTAGATGKAAADLEKLKDFLGNAARVALAAQALWGSTKPSWASAVWRRWGPHGSHDRDYGGTPFEEKPVVLGFALADLVDEDKPNGFNNNSLGGFVRTAAQEHRPTAEEGLWQNVEAYRRYDPDDSEPAEPFSTKEREQWRATVDKVLGPQPARSGPRTPDPNRHAHPKPQQG